MIFVDIALNFNSFSITEGLIFVSGDFKQKVVVLGDTYHKVRDPYPPSGSFVIISKIENLSLYPAKIKSVCTESQKVPHSCFTYDPKLPLFFTSPLSNVTYNILFITVISASPIVTVGIVILAVLNKKKSIYTHIIIIGALASE